MNIKKNISITLLSIFGFVIAYYCYFLLKFPNLTFSDQMVHITVLLNQYILFPVGGSRFFPFLGLEYIPIFRSGLSHDMIVLWIYIIQSLKIVCFFVLLYFTFKQVTNRFLATIFLWFFFIASFSANILMHFEFTHGSELLLAIMTTLFIYSYLRFLREDRMFYFILCLLICFYAVYLKEVAFIIFTAISGFRLLVMNDQCSKREKILHILIFLNSIVFLLLYYKFAYTSSSNYAEGRVSLTKINLIKSIFTDHYIFVLALLIACFRSVQIVLYKKIILADVFLFSALSFFSSFIILHLNSNYYFFPAYIPLFIALAEYSTNIEKPIANLRSMVNIGKLQNFFLSMIILAVILVFGFSSVNLFIHQKSAEFFRYVQERIVVKPVVSFIDSFGLSSKEPFVFYAPPINEYLIPFEWHQTNWCYVVLKKLHGFYSINRVKPFQNAKTATEALKFLKTGQMIVYAGPRPKDNLQWLSGREIKTLTASYYTFYYHEAFEQNVNEALCSMADELQASLGNEFKMLLPSLYTQLQLRSCLGMPPVSLKNIENLKVIVDALKRYYSDFGEYPKSSGFDGYATQWGATKGEFWIDGLVPDYLPALPRDERRLGDGIHEYLYRSDGKDFKLIAHVADNIEAIQYLMPELIDARKHSAGYWTFNATDW